jgi:hypothetical protein
LYSLCNTEIVCEEGRPRSGSASTAESRHCTVACCAAVEAEALLVAVGADGGHPKNTPPVNCAGQQTNSMTQNAAWIDDIGAVDQDVYKTKSYADVACRYSLQNRHNFWAAEAPPHPVFVKAVNAEHKRDDACHPDRACGESENIQQQAHAMWKSDRDTAQNKPANGTAGSHTARLTVVYPAPSQTRPKTEPLLPCDRGWEAQGRSPVMQIARRQNLHASAQSQV